MPRSIASLPVRIGVFCAASLMAQSTEVQLRLDQIHRGLLQPDYPVAYAPAEEVEIAAVLERVHGYLESCTPKGLVDRESGEAVRDLAAVDAQTTVAPSAYRLVSYEWGVTYCGMLRASEVTADSRYRDYAAERLAFVVETAPAFAPFLTGGGEDRRNPFRSVLAPRSLDDAGSMAAALIKAERAGLEGDWRPSIETYLVHLCTGQKRFADGTLARDRPLPDSLWLDDLYMSVPALAQMGVLTGEEAYFDDAVRQVLRFGERMFVAEEGLFMHGWVEGMEPHPRFFWGRANGWAWLAMTELLSVLPEDHPSRAEVLALYRSQARGLAAVQGIDGRWHQLLDRAETYPETSCTAMFVYGFARGINRGWLDPLAYGPMVSVGWNATAAQVNPEGQVEGTCVGTGMGFDPVFYAYRPTSVYAAHGYGPVLLAGAEMIELRRQAGRQTRVHDGALQVVPSVATD